MSDNFEYGEAGGIIDKAEINGVTYVVAVYHETGDRHKHAILVWADTVEGEDHGRPDHPNLMMGRAYSNYDLIVREKFTRREASDTSLEKLVSGVINHAVCHVEEKLDEQQMMEDKVAAAVEANQEIHGGIDYELEKGE